MNQVVVADGDGGEGQGAVGVEVSLGYHRVGGVVGRYLEHEKHMRNFPSCQCVFAEKDRERRIK